MSGRPGRLAGTVRWGVVPFAPRPPFRLYAGRESEPVAVPDVEQLAKAAKEGGDAEFTYLVAGKARPVLVLNEPPPAHHREVTALRLLRLSRLEPEEQAEVRNQRHELLFHLDPNRFQLPEENAAMVSALVRVHVGAISAGPPAGTLNANELRVIGERIIRYYGFDTRLLVERRIRELAQRRGS